MGRLGQPRTVSGKIPAGIHGEHVATAVSTQVSAESLRHIQACIYLNAVFEPHHVTTYWDHMFPARNPEYAS